MTKEEFLARVDERCTAIRKERDKDQWAFYEQHRVVGSTQVLALAEVVYEVLYEMQEWQKP